MKEHERLSILRDKLIEAHKEMELAQEKVEVLENKVEYLKSQKYS